MNNNIYIAIGCPTNETNNEGLTPQKIAKNEGTKDAMKELKKLSGFQDKVSRGAKPKGYAEPWSIKVSIELCLLLKNSTLYMYNYYEIIAI